MFVSKVEAIADLELSIRQVVADILEIPAHIVKSDARLGETAHWDSLRNMIILTEVERIYDVQFDMAEMETATSVSAIRGLLAAKGKYLACNS